MKGRIIFMLAVLLTTGGCTKEGGRSLLHLSFSKDYSHPSIARLKSNALPLMGEIHLPDTNDFILSIVQGEDRVIYEGSYGGRPDPISLEAGNYTVGVYSCDFAQPAFDRPQFGDEQMLVVQGGESLRVRFLCGQLNSGVKIAFGPHYREKFQHARLSLTSEAGQLDYPLTEERFAYFSPGRMDIRLDEGSGEEIIATKDLQAATLLRLKLDASSSELPEGGSLSIQIDTSRTWIDEQLVIGDENDGSSPEKAVDAGTVRQWTGAQKIWVKGYIVGGDATQSGLSFTPPFKTGSHLVISSQADGTQRERCVVIELPKGRIRDSLSLVAHPEHLKKILRVKGDVVESYFKLPGVKNTRDFRLEE